MNPVMKKIIFVIAFILVALVLPMVVMLFFVDTESRFSTYIFVYALIIFSVLGYIIASVRSMEKALESALEEIKMQNAAIAYKISNTELEEPKRKEENKVEEKNTFNIPLNPAEPLIVAEPKAAPDPKKVIDDNFDDFK